MDDLHENAKDSQTIIRTERLSSRAASHALVCLNFKVPLRIRQQFKMYAARHNITMTELLLKILDDLLISEGNNGRLNNALTQQEVKK